MDRIGKIQSVIADIRYELDIMYHGSAWDRGVGAYAHDLVDGLEEDLLGGWHELDDLRSPVLLEKWMLNGAEDWKRYSYTGCALCYDGQIAERLCTPSQLKKCKNGANRMGGVSWLDHQARAVYQASRRVHKAVHKVMEERTDE